MELIIFFISFIMVYLLLTLVYTFIQYKKEQAEKREHFRKYYD